MPEAIYGSMRSVRLVLNFRFIQPTFTSTSILVFLLGLAVFASTVGTTFAFTSIGTTSNDVLLVLFHHVRYTMSLTSRYYLSYRDRPFWVIFSIVKSKEKRKASITLPCSFISMLFQYQPFCVREPRSVLKHHLSKWVPWRYHMMSLWSSPLLILASTYRVIIILNLD